MLINYLCVPPPLRGETSRGGAGFQAPPRMPLVISIYVTQGKDPSAVDSVDPHHLPSTDTEKEEVYIDSGYPSPV